MISRTSTHYYQQTAALTLKHSPAEVCPASGDAIQLLLFPWEVQYSPRVLQPMLCRGAHIRILAQGPVHRGYGRPVWKHRGQEGPRWRDMGLEVSLQVKACRRQQRENEDTCFFCMCVLAQCWEQLLLCHWYSTGNLSWGLCSPFWSISEANRQKQST